VQRGELLLRRHHPETRPDADPNKDDYQYGNEAIGEGGGTERAESLEDDL
jgi:hypothetical protein